MLEKKIYFFDFGSNSKKIISYIESFFMYLSLLFLIIFGGIFFLYGKMESVFENEYIQTLFIRIAVICILIFEIYGLILQFLPKNIILTEKGIKIKRNNISRLSLRIFNDYIKYEKIKSCELNNPKFRSRQVMQLPFILFDWDSVVKIQQGIKTFYIPVENAEEFVAEVNRRTEAISTENDSLC